MSVESAQQAAEDATGSPVKHLESVPVVETFRGQIIWKGIVEVYGVTKPPPDKAYAWAVESAGGGTDYIAVLGIPPVNTPIDAVRAWIVSQGG